MDSFTPGSGNTNNQSSSGVTPPRPMSPSLRSDNLPKNNSSRALWLSITILYVIVLAVSVFSVYAWQNNKLAVAQKSVAAVQNVPKQPDESSNIESDKYAAVFLTGGQVYFGNIAELNPQFLTLTHVYYLRSNSSQIQSGPASSSVANDTSLVKLGCELHGPTDKMVINRTEVSFWENLKSDGQVSKATINYAKQNPAGQKCT